VNRILPISLLLLILAIPIATTAQPNDADALKLLDQLGKRYQAAKSYHIELVQESRTSTDLSSSWSKVLMTAYQAPGDRYRFEGSSQQGSAEVISNGTTEWDYRSVFAEFAKRPVGSYRQAPQLGSDNNWLQPDTQIESQATFLVKSLVVIADSLKSAHFLPEETIDIGGRTIRCVVVGFGSADSLKQSPVGIMTTTVWIDKEKMTIVKQVSVGDSVTPWTPNGPPRHGIVTHHMTTSTYLVAALDEPIPESVFTFQPPEDAKLVQSFADPNLDSILAYRGRAQPNMIGRPAPRITLGDGGSFDLRAFRGKPVLIDEWATWCTPCLEEMPFIDHIFKATKDVGLVVLGVDQDEKAEDATNFLHRKNYVWKNVHAGEDNVGVRIPNSGIPLVVLLDAEGNIVYNHSGGNDEKGLMDALKELGPSYAAALETK
jgi:outer membrane lipoprotein-sorting protein